MYKRFHNELALISESFGIDLTPLSKQWCATYESRLQSRGKKDAVKFVKELNTVGERYALRQDITAIPWTISDKDNFPKCINKFKPYLRSSDSRKVVLALSLLRSCEALRLPISKDISSVTAPSSADTNLIEDIIDFIPKWVKRIKHKFDLPEISYHFTLKNGPNGHALKSSDSDIAAVVNDPKLFKAIQTVQRKLSDPMPMRYHDLPTREGNHIHSKITQFPEKSGKTRTIAIVDYYSQRCLKPLHDYVMSLLSNLVSDGTYSHQAVGKYAQQKTKEKSFILCADLSNATDRFPAIIQRLLLFNIIEDKDLAQALWTLLAERSFKLAWSDEIVTYSCGQPMGAYASWPLFSLAHHLVVEYCAEKLDIKQPKHLYRMIGDDIIITEERLSQKYLEVIQLLGVELSLSKTVLSPESSDKSGAEVAKQLYLNGICLTPLTPGFVRNLRKPYMLNASMKVLRERYEFFRPETLPCLIKIFCKRKSKLAWLLCSNPINGIIKPGMPGYNENSPWTSVNTEEKIKSYYKMAGNLLTDKALKMMNDSNMFISSPGSPWKDSAQPPARCMAYVVMTITMRLTYVMNDLINISANETPEALVAAFDFIPDPNTPFMERKEMRQKRISSLIQSLFSYNDDTKYVRLG